MQASPGARISPRLAILAAIFIPALVLLALTIVAHVAGGIPFEMFARDTTATLQGHPLTGVQSRIGVLVWSAAAAICLFSAGVLRGGAGLARLPAFLLCSGVISGMLSLDDFFQIHEDLAPRYLGVGERWVLAGYLAGVAGWLLAFRDVILRTEWLPLLLACAFFGASLAVDAAQDRWASPWRIFFEDGLKLLGIVAWSGYLIRCCAQALAVARQAPHA